MAARGLVIILIFKLFILCPNILCASEIPGFVPVDASQVDGARLLLPEVGGSMEAPGKDFHWLKTTALKCYLTLDSVSGERYIVKVDELNTPPDSKSPSPEFMKGLLQGGVTGIERQGGKVIRQELVELDCPPYGKVSGYIVRGELPKKSFTMLSYCFVTGRHSIIVGGFPDDGTPTANFKKMLSSVKFKPEQPLEPVAAPEEVRRNPTIFIFVGYLLWGGLFGLLTQFFAKALMGKSINPYTAGIVWVLIGLTVRVFYIGLSSDLDAEKTGERIGEELTYAVLPAVIFWYKAKKPAAAPPASTEPN